MSSECTRWKGAYKFMWTHEVMSQNGQPGANQGRGKIAGRKQKAFIKPLDRKERKKKESVGKYVSIKIRELLEVRKAQFPK